MNYETIRLDIDGQLARLELSRPDAANAITLRLAQELEDAVYQLSEAGDIRAVLLTGGGTRFCGGGDVNDFATTPPDDLSGHLADITSHLHPAIQTLVELDAPVIAAVQGSAAGAGLGLALAADLVLAARSAKFVMAFTGIGMSPDGSSSWFLPRIVGQHRALELVLTNRVLSAEEAREWGIVTTVVDDGELTTAAETLARSLAAGPTKAFGRAARLLRGAWDVPLGEHLGHERDQLAASGATHDGQEGIAAFVAKRPPVFEGR